MQTEVEAELLKIVYAALFTKVAGWGLVCQPGPRTAIVEGVVPAQSQWARLGQPCCGGSVPSWGSHGAPAWRQQDKQQDLALPSQEGTFSFGVPRKNCRTRSARSARQKSKIKTWAMTSLNCRARSDSQLGAHR